MKKKADAICRRINKKHENKLKNDKTK